MANPFITQSFNNQLPFVPSVSAGDLIPISSQDMGVFAFVNMGTLAAYIQTLITLPTEFIQQFASPLTGALMVMNQTSDNAWLVISPLGTIATATIQLPGIDSAIDGQVVQLTTTQTITAVTFSATGCAFSGVPANITALLPRRFRFCKVFNTWFLV